MSIFNLNMFHLQHLHEKYLHMQPVYDRMKVDFVGPGFWEPLVVHC